MKKLLALIALLSIGAGYAVTHGTTPGLKCMHDCETQYEPELKSAENALLDAQTNLKNARLSKNRLAIKTAEAAYEIALAAHDAIATKYLGCALTCDTEQ